MDRGRTRPALSVLVLNWNRPDLTSALLRDLGGSLPADKESVEILVLDNGSTTPIPAWWLDAPWVQLIRSDVNLGYAGGMSLLVDLASASHAWLLNNDCRLGKNALDVALAAIQRHDAAVIFPLVENPDGTVQSHDCHWSPVLGWRRGRHPRPGDDAYPIFGDIFAAPIISLDIVKRLRLLPQGFHSYGEDFDACYAVAMAGERIVRDSSIVVQHALSQSRPESPRDLYVVQVQAVRNVLASAMLNYGRAALWISFPLLFLKMWLHELLWRQRGLLRKCGLVPRQFFSLPVEVLRLYTSQRALRQLRQDQRARSDLAVWRLP